MSGARLLGNDAIEAPGEGANDGNFDEGGENSPSPDPCNRVTSGPEPGRLAASTMPTASPINPLRKLGGFGSAHGHARRPGRWTVLRRGTSDRSMTRAHFPPGAASA
jgi:hypothetical protein